MYNYLGSTLRPKGKNTTWQTVDISNKMLFDIFDKYSSGYITLKSPYLTTNTYVDINSIRNSSTYKLVNVPFLNWLSLMGNTTITGYSEEPIYTRQQVYSGDVWYHGYDVARVLTGISDNPNLPASSYRNLKITKPNAPVATMNKRALYTVNGHLHITTPLADGVLIKDGANSLDLCGKNSIGLLSFASIGDIALVKVLPTMIGKADPNYDYSEGVYITLGKSLRSKSLIFSFGGYFHLQDDLFTIINEEKGIVKVNPRSVDLVLRILISQDIIDLTSLGLSTSRVIDAVVAREIYRDDVLLKYFDLSQTFFAIVNTPSLTCNRIPLDNVQLPGTYESFNLPTSPFISEQGLLYEYAVTMNDETYQLHVNENIYRFPLYERGNVSAQNVVPGGTGVGDFDSETGYLLNINSNDVSVVE